MPSPTFLASALILPALALAQNTIRPNAALYYCVQSQYGSMVEGAPLVLGACTGGAHQAFTHSTETALLSVFSNMCVSLKDDFKPGDPFTLKACDENDANQRFDIREEQMQIRHELRQACFALGGDVGTGTAIVGQDCVDDSADQKFFRGTTDAAPTPAPAPPTSTGAWFVSQDMPWMCLTAASETEGAAVVVADCDHTTSPAQWFHYDHDAQTITVFNGTLCVDGTNNPVTLSTCDSSAASQKFKSAQENHIASVESGLCLVPGDASQGVWPVALRKCVTESSFQRWYSPKKLPTPPPHALESNLDPDMCIGATAQEAGAAVVTLNCDETDVTQSPAYDRSTKAMKVGDFCWAAVDDAVLLAECDGSAEQQFKSAINNRIAVASDGRCITATDSPVVLTECSLTSLAQVWVTPPSGEQ